MEAVAGVPRKTIARHYRQLLRTGVLRAVPLPRPQDYVSRFCAELGLSSRTQTATLRLLGEWDRTGITGSSSPVGAAATAIYLAAESCGERKFQTEVAKVTGVTEVTLRTRLALAKRCSERQARLGGRGTDSVRSTPPPS
jgi:transcription initiation factor TFIIB